MVGSGPHQTESMGFQREDHFVNLERKKDWEGSVHTTHISRSHSWGGSHLFYVKNTKAMQLEIDHLKRSLRHERQRRTPSNSDFSFDGEEDGSFDADQGLLLVSLSHMMRTTVMSAETKIHLPKAWEMML